LISRTIKQDTIEFVCPIACPSIGPISSDNKRVTLGLPDNNNDGYPEVSGAVDLNKIYLNYIRMNDIYRSTTKYKLYTTANYVQADHRFTLDAALLAKNPSVNLTPEGNPTITLRRAGTETPITGTIVRMSASSNDFIIKWEDALPGTWGAYQINDEVTVSQDYKLNTEIFKNTSNAEVSFIPATFNSTIYIASAPTTANNNWTYTGPLKTSCLSLKSGVRFVTSLRINPSTFYQNTSSICNFVEYATVLNTSGTTFSFPFEYRNYAELDEIKYTLSSGFTYNSTYSAQLTISGYVSGSIDAFRTISGNVVTYDIKSYRNSLANSTVLRKYPLENQTTWITIKAFPNSRCDTQANLTIANDMKYRRTFNYSPLDETTLSTSASQSYLLSSNYTYNLLNATATTPVSQTPNSGTGSYGFKLTNPSATQSISNGWFYLKPQAGNIIVSNVKIGGVAATPNANGFYLVPAVAANTFKDVTFDMTLTGNCNADFIKVYYANECTLALIPTSFSTISCSKQIDFTINPAVASMDAQVKTLNGGLPYAFCAPLTVEFDVSSASLGSIFDIKTKVDLATGLEYVPNSVKVKYPGTGTFTAVSYNPVISGSGNQLDFNVTTPSLGGIGIISQTFLPGTGNVPQNIVSVQYQVRTICGADEGVPIQHTFTSNKSCGNPLTPIIKQSDPIVFSNVVSFAYSMDFTRTRSAIIKNCTTGSPFHISMKNVGPGSTPSDNEISLVIPSTMQFASYNTSSGNIRNGATVQPDDQDNGDGTHTLSWPITSNVAQGDSIVMDVMLKPVEGLSVYPTLGVFLFVGKNISLTCAGAVCDVFKMNGFKVYNVASEGGPDVPNVTVNQPNCTTAKGSYTIDSPTGTGFTYSLDSGAYTSSTSVSNLNPGTYTVHVQNANQCFNQTVITIQPQPDLAVVPTLVTEQPTCLISTGKITVTSPLASAGYVFSIDGGAYTSSNVFNVAANTAPHTVSAKRTTSVCAETATSAAIISQPVTLPAPGTITGINSVLPGTSQSYSISPVSGAISYLWTLPVSWTATTTALNSTSVSATIGSNGGIVKVAAISVDGCTSPSSNLTITTGCRAGEVAPTMASTSFSINCGATFNLSTLIGTNQPAGCSNCLLTFHSDSIASNANKLTGVAITAAVVGNYYAAWFDPSNGCYSNLATKILVKNIYPAKPTITKTNPTCTLATGTIEITNPVGAAYTYSKDNINYQSLPIFSGLNPGDYYIRIKNNFGCTTDSLGINIAIQPVSTVPTGSGLQIYTGTKTIAALQALGTSIKWYSSGSGGTVLPNTTSLTDESTYYATQFVNGCESNRLAVTVNRISDDMQTLCANSTFGDLITTPTSSQSIKWFGSSTSTTPLPLTNTLSSGTYFVEQYSSGGQAMVSTFAGSLAGLSSTIDGQGTAARFSSLHGITTDSIGNVYVTENPISGNGGIIRKITPSGLVSTIATSAGSSVSLDGPIGTAKFSAFGIAINSLGEIFFGDSENYAIKKISTSGYISTFIGGNGSGDQPGLGTAAKINSANGMAFGPDGYLYFSDESNNKIKKVSPAGEVTDFAGSGNLDYVDGPGNTAAFASPHGVAFDSSGNLYVADFENYAVRKITSSGVVSTLAGGSFTSTPVDANGSSASFGNLWHIAVDSKDNVYVTQDGGYPVDGFIRKIAPNGDVTLYAGNGATYLIDSLATESSFDNPYHLSIDKFDNMYLNETGGHRVRKITPNYTNRVAVNVVIDAIPQPTLTVEQPTCTKASGKITVTSPLGSIFSYSINGGTFQSSPIFDNLTTSASYSVKVKSSTIGCESDTTTVTISNALIVPAKPVISNIRPLIFCAGDSTVLVSNTLNGNQWYKNGIAIPGAINNTLTVLSAGNYKTQITSLDACKSLFSDSVDVTVNTVPTVSISSSSNPGNLLTICEIKSDATPGEVIIGSEVKHGITIQNPNNFDFEWSKNNALISSAVYPSINTSSIGTYRLKVINKLSGCVAISDTIKVQNFVAPVVTLSSTQVAAWNYICAGKPVVVKANSTSAGLEYRWKDYYAGVGSSGFTSSAGVIGASDSIVHSQIYLHNVTLSVGDQPWITPTNAGIYGLAQYYLEVKDSNGCIYKPGIFRFYEALPVAKPVISGDTLGTYCADKTVVLVSSKTSGNQWYKDGAIIIGANNDSLTITSSGSYQVKYTNDLACESELSLARNVTIISLPIKPVISGNTNSNYCEGSSVVISSSSITGNQWYKNGTLISGAVNMDYSVTNSGIYSLKVTNSNGCVSVKSDSIDITIKPIPLAIIEQGVELSFSNCTNIPITLKAKDQVVSGSTSYEWYYKSTFSGSESILPTTTQNHSATNAGYYRVKVTTDGCYEISSLTRIYDPPILNTTSTAVCVGDSVTISALNSGIPNPIYKWFKNNVELSGESNVTLKAYQTGTYYVQVSSSSSIVSANSCPVYITVNSLPSVSITGNPSNLKACSGDSVILSAVASGASSYTYKWIKDGTLLSDTLINFSANVNGNYQVRVNDNNGCVNTSAISSVEILALPNPPSIAVLSQTTCTTSTGSIKVNSPIGAGYTYSMDGGTFQMNNTFLSVNVGEHSVRVKNADGCISLASNMVEILANAGAPSLPVATVTEQPTCFVSIGKIVVTAPIGAEYTYSIDSTTYQSGLNFSSVSAGSYRLRVKNTDGCISESATLLNVIANPGVPTIPVGSVSVQPTCGTPTGTIKFKSQSGVEFSVNNGTSYAADSTFSGLNSGTYTLKVRRLSNSCTTAAVSTVTINAVPNAPIAPTLSATPTQPTCAIPTGTIKFKSQSGVKYSVNNGISFQADSTFSGLNPGIYTLKVRSLTDSTCTTNAASIVTINAVPNAPIAPILSSTPTQPTCAIPTGTIKFKSQSGVNYSVNNGTSYQADSTFSGLNPGIYTLKVRSLTDSTCITGAVSTVTINAISSTPIAPNATSHTIINNCNLGNSVDLTSLQPSASAGIIYEWWTGTDSTKVSQISNPNSYSVASKVYLWSKNVNGCYSSKADSVKVSIVTCCVDSPGSIVQKNPFLVGEIYEPGDITTLKHIGFGSGDQIKYVLVNVVDDKIKAINNTVPEFTSVISGDYRIYAITHRPEAVVSGITVGNKLSDVTPFCANWAYYNVGVVVSCDYYETFVMDNDIPSASGQSKKFALIDVGTNNIVEISSLKSFIKRPLRVYQIVELLYTGTVTNLTIGNNINDVTASTLDKTASKYFSNCDAVYVEFQGYMFHDKNKNGIENFPEENSIILDNHTIFVKILDSSNQVISTWPVSGGYFNFGQNFNEGTYRFIYDNNDDVTDTIPNYPPNWNGSPKYFTVENGTVITPNFTNTSGQLVPFGMYSTLVAPTPGPSGASINYCLNATASALQAQGVTGSTLIWYTVPTGGMALTSAPVPLTSTAGTTHYYVSQTIDDVESVRLDISVVVSGLVTMPSAISGPTMLVAGSNAVYRISPVSGASSYVWQLPVSFTGSSSVDSIVVTAGTSSGLIQVAAVSSSGCQSGFKSLSLVVSEDFDGDGVSNTQEATDGTDPNNGCEYLAIHVTLPQSEAWKLLDCDGDGNPNKTDPEPLNFCVGGINNVIPSPGSPQYEFFKEADCDNDGIPNNMECFNAITTCQDFDGDGIPNYLDQDSDGDAIPDRVEKNRDSDGDKSADYLDLDSDNDGILDSIELSNDFDRDGIPNYLDLDSDNDHILDAWEALALYRGPTDENYDGRVDKNGVFIDDVNTPNGLADFLEKSKGGRPVEMPDTDNDGMYDFWDVDSDNDCISDSQELTQDTDGDNIPNYRDIDSDNDCISDLLEAGNCAAPVDTDGDGTADYMDTDSDNDCIPDKMEAGKDCNKPADTDGDGIPDFKDTDSDNDCIPDKKEVGADCNNPVDTDGDGIPDFKDTDSDNDCIPDKMEVGKDCNNPVDTDGDGLPDFKDMDSDNDCIPDKMEVGKDCNNPTDTDGDGIPDFKDMDSDNDCIPDKMEVGKDCNNPTDTDGDGIPDFKDTDSDNDCIPDKVEVGKDCNNPTDTDGDGIPDFKDMDSDNDCIPDKMEVGKDCNNPVDTDDDGIPDFKDTDSDNDCIPDKMEAGKDCNNPVDTDGDGIPDFKDTDSDNDCIKDSMEAGADCNNPIDTDGDGIPDFKDTDSDNDCIKDSMEVGSDCNKPVDTDGDDIPDYKDTDSDNDCIKDSMEVGLDCNKPVDTDGDGIPDYRDTDSDNDCIKDSLEVGKDCNKPVDTDGDGIPDFKDTDSDNDCIKDSLEVGADCNKPIDTDGDGIPDFKDTDSDNDCINDALEVGADCNKPVDTDGDGIPDYKDTDSDNDCIPDRVEVGSDCSIPLDSDQDGLPNYRDTDSDNDCISDNLEADGNCLNPIDTDKDGLPDYLDRDSDGDCIPDAVEVGPKCNKPVDTDGDGLPNYKDLDSDNDCIPDAKEAGKDCNKPVDTDKDGTQDYLDLDSDNDTYTDNFEAGADCKNPVDTDKDGQPDFQDLDSDGDGIPDKLEDDIDYGNMLDCDKDGIPNRLDPDQCNVFLPKGISPNGDGKNDRLIIPGILSNNKNRLTIFNRWGNVVFESENYKNNWSGQTDKAFDLLSTDGLLPDGTYYYVIDFMGARPTIGAYVYINRLEK